MTLEYIRQSLYFFRRHFGTLAAIQLPFLVALNLLGLLIQQDVQPGTTQMHQADALLMLANLTVLPIYWGGTILFLQSAVDNQPLGALQAIRGSLKYWRRLLLTYLLTGLAVTLGLMLLIVPGVYAGVRLVFADYICVLENRKPMDALRQSWGQSDDYFWLLLRGLLVIFGGLFLLEFPLMYLAGPHGLDLGPFGRIIDILFDLLGTLVTIYGFRIYCLMKQETVEAAPRGE